MFSFAAGTVLLMIGIIAALISRDKWSPASVFPLTWAFGLWGVSASEVFGFYPIESEALLLYIAGSLVFSIVGIATYEMLRKLNHNTVAYGYFYNPINARKMVFFFCLLHLAVLPSIYIDLTSLSPDLVQAAYIARQRSVEGDEVLGWAASNYLQVGTMLIPLFVVCYLKKWCSASSLLIISTPWALLILLASGRSGLLQLLIGVMFIWVIVRGKLSAKLVFWVGGCFILVLIGGAIATAKVALDSDESAGDFVYTFLEHFAGYAFQGPVLFSRYFDGDISLEPLWSPFSSICHMLSFVGLCIPDPQHLAFNRYAPYLEGNVYSMYFSLYPKFGVLGVIAFLSLYSAISTYTYFKAKAGNVYYMMLASFFMSSIVLSLFSDQISSSWWSLIKLTVLIALVFVLFTDRKKIRRDRAMINQSAGQTPAT
ncbi:oligosaccharide repeat unit polymerase [Pseudomonas rhodesiae]|jgi:oligosaccharide repeat unit polymerase|uniref:O-antigen polymerase n=1 Tax=Pseudomonas rhodesiae TaxID=76760 RepID=UPI0014767DD4|nr:O-antigen polymerase [Pseudomonas rhodesiae]NMY77676.1 oligosaccharide repeat unit polymerase [Pseudomonas rhodesiae]